MRICDFLQQTEASWTMEECGCALCQLVAEQCGNVVQFGPQSNRGTQTRLNTGTRTDENTTKHRPDLKMSINADSPNLVDFVSVSAFRGTGTRGCNIF